MDFADLADSVVDEFAVEVIYSPNGGDDSTFNAIIEYEPAEEEQGQDGTELVRRATMVVRATDVAAPNRLDTVTIAGEKWSVMSIEPQALGSVFDLGLLLTSSIERSRETLRRGRG